MPRRPPAAWFRKMVAEVSDSATDPEAVVGHIWHHVLSPSKRKEILAREGGNPGMTKRKGRLKKGSPAAKAYMAKLRGMIGRKRRSRRASPTRKKSKKRSNPVAKRRRRRPYRKYARRVRKIGLKGGIIGSVVRGLGGNYLASILTSFVAPQFAPIAGVAGAWYFGGWKGALGAEAIKMLTGQPSILSGLLGGFFGGGSSGEAV